MRGAARREALIGDRRGGRLVGWGASITAVLLEGSLQNNTELKTMGLMEGWKIRKFRRTELEEAGRNHPLQQLLTDMYGDTITVNDAVKRRAQVSAWHGLVWHCRTSRTTNVLPPCSRLRSIKTKIWSANDLRKRGLESWD